MFKTKMSEYEDISNLSAIMRRTDYGFSPNEEISINEKLGLSIAENINSESTLIGSVKLGLFQTKTSDYDDCESISNLSVIVSGEQRSSSNEDHDLSDAESTGGTLESSRIDSLDSAEIQSEIQIIKVRFGSILKSMYTNTVKRKRGIGSVNKTVFWPQLIPCLVRS